MEIRGAVSDHDLVSLFSQHPMILKGLKNNIMQSNGRPYSWVRVQAYLDSRWSQFPVVSSLGEFLRSTAYSMPELQIDLDNAGWRKALATMPLYYPGDVRFFSTSGKNAMAAVNGLSVKGVVSCDNLFVQGDAAAAAFQSRGAITINGDIRATSNYKGIACHRLATSGSVHSSYNVNVTGDVIVKNDLVAVALSAQGLQCQNADVGALRVKGCADIRDSLIARGPLRIKDLGKRDTIQAMRMNVKDAMFVGGVEIGRLECLGNLSLMGVFTESRVGNWNIRGTLQADEATIVRDLPITKRPGMVLREEPSFVASRNVSEPTMEMG